MSRAVPLLLPPTGTFPHHFWRPAERETMTSAIRFRVAAGFGMILLALMMVMFVFGGVAFPAQIGNVGEISMSAQTMNTQQFALAGAGKTSPQQGGGVLSGETTV